MRTKTEETASCSINSSLHFAAEPPEKNAATVKTAGNLSMVPFSAGPQKQLGKYELFLFASNVERSGVRRKLS